MQRCVASVVGSVGRACSALIVGAVFVLLAAECGGRGYVERQALDAFWEQHMLAGASGNSVQRAALRALGQFAQEAIP